MSSFTVQKPDFLTSGERARLIPVIADTSKEERATSCTLAALMSVDEFAKALFHSIGVPFSKTSRIQCFTEAVFSAKDKTAPKIRPDGLIMVTRGKNTWSALVEAKIGNAMLEKDQIETYLDLAKEHNIDAVITLSNQFSTKPTHHPITVNKHKLRRVSLYHWSWTYLMSEAMMWVKYHGVNDPDQSYILEELVRYLQHDSSGVLSFYRMCGTWKDACSAVQNRITLKKASPEVLDSIGSWHQFIRNLSLRLSLAIGVNTTISLKRAHMDNAHKRLEDDAAQFVSRYTLTAEFHIPDTAGRIKLRADAERRRVNVSMRLRAPEEIVTAKGRINWFIRQLEKTSHPDITIRAIWRGRSPDTMANLTTLREQGIEPLLCDNSALRPTAFEVELTRDLGARFKGAKTFIQESEPLPLEFYEQAGQHLKKWVASPPKIKNIAEDTEMEKLELGNVDHQKHP